MFFSRGFALWHCPRGFALWLGFRAEFRECAILTTKEHKERWGGLDRNTKAVSHKEHKAMIAGIFTTKEHKELLSGMYRSTKATEAGRESHKEHKAMIADF